MSKDPATALFLRTVDADHKSYKGFQWPREVGAVVVAPDWSPEAVCGRGLHGLMWGEGDASLLSNDAVWQVVEAVESASVCLSGKRKFASCTIRYVGDRDGAVHYILSNGGAGRAVAYCTATAGNEGTATAGDEGTATAGDEGTLILKWHDGKRYRITIGYVGEGGIDPSKKYRCDEAGKITEVPADKSGTAT